MSALASRQFSLVLDRKHSKTIPVCVRSLDYFICKQFRPTPCPPLHAGKFPLCSTERAVSPNLNFVSADIRVDAWWLQPGRFDGPHHGTGRGDGQRDGGGQRCCQQENRAGRLCAQGTAALPRAPLLEPGVQPGWWMGYVYHQCFFLACFVLPKLFGCTSGGVYVPCIFSHARWELL